MSSDDYAAWIEEDIRNYPNNSTWGVIGPRVSGSLSVLCSILIIYVILRSSTRLSSPYHRIMMGMSIHDILGSAAIALTTLPFPRDDKWVNLYSYNGKRLGNYATCDAQGFFQFYGLTGSYFYNMVLCVYYACTLSLSIKEKTMERKIEPWLHVIPVCISIWISVQILIEKGYNPAPRRASWCTMTPLPYSCLETSSPPPCERGSTKAHFRMESYITIISTVKVIIIVVSLSLVCAKVTLLYCSVRRSRRNDGTMTEEQVANLHNHFSVVRATFIQALAYILALFVTMIPPLLLLIIPENYFFFLQLQPVLLPLQGIFNFSIFVGAKIYHIRKADSELSIIKALSLIMIETSFKDDVEAVVLSGVPSALERGNVMDLSLESSSSRAPSIYDVSEEKSNDFSDNLSYTQGSQDRNSSVADSAWDGVSWKSQSTNNHGLAISECRSGSVSTGLSLSTRQQ